MDAPPGTAPHASRMWRVAATIWSSRLVMTVGKKYVVPSRTSARAMAAGSCSAVWPP